MKRKKQINRKLELGENVKYDDAVNQLTIHFSPELGSRIGNLFMQLELDKKNMNVDTYMDSMKDIFMLFYKRNKGINKDDEAFINEQDILNLIKKYPRILSQDILKNVANNIKVLNDLSSMNIRKVNKLIKGTDGYIFSTGLKKLSETCIFLDNLNVIEEDKSTRNAAEYMLCRLGEKNLQVNTRKIYSRLMHICALNKSTNIEKKEFDFCYKRNEKEYEKRYGINQEELYYRYVLPITTNTEEYKKRIKQSIENIINPQFGEIPDNEKCD